MKTSICNCDIKCYYCHCDGENKLLNRLQKINVKKLKMHICCQAIKCNHLNILKWFLTEKKSCRFQFWHNDIAAEKGYLNIIKWLFTQYQSNIPSPLITEKALINDHLHILKWLVEINAPLNIDNNQHFKIGINCLKYLFEINKIKIIKNKENLKEIEYFKLIIQFH